MDDQSSIHKSQVSYPQHRIPISQLVADPANARKHDKKNLNAIKSSLAKFGQQKPIVVAPNNTVLAGNGTLYAAIDLGWSDIWAHITDLKGFDQTAYAIADNRSAELAAWDNEILGKTLEALKAENFDLIDLGFDPNDLDAIMPEQIAAGLTDDDSVPEIDQNIHGVVEGDIWQLGNHRLMCGDSTNVQHVEKLMNGAKADMVFTDPPYGVDIVKDGMVGANFGVAEKGSYKKVEGDNTTNAANEFYQTCIAHGFKTMIIWGGNYFTDFLPPSKSWVVWNKRGDTTIKNTFADAELAWSNIGFPVRIHNQLWNGMIREGEKDKRVHPTQKPIALADYCFSLIDTKIIYDGFLGSGSTLIACEKTARKCYGMEIDPHYCSVIIERWQKFTGKEAKRLLTTDISTDGQL